MTTTKHHLRLWVPPAVLTAVVLMIGACGGAGGTQPTPSAPTATPTSARAGQAQERAQAIIGALDAEKAESLDAVEELASLGRAAAPALLPLVDSETVAVRWSALYYLSRNAQAEDAPLLVRGLSDSNTTNRALAAAALLRLGDERGSDMLREASESQEPLSFSSPPRLLADYAKGVLEVSRTGPSAGLGQDGGQLARRVLPRPAGLAAPLLQAQGEDAPVKVRREGEVIRVSINVQFSGDGVTQELIDRWVKTASQVWNGLPAAPPGECCSLVVTISPAAGAIPRRGFVQVEVDRSIFRFRWEATGGHPPVVEADATPRVALWSTDSGYAFSYALGVLMGAPVEHQYDPTGRWVSTGFDALLDALGNEGPSIMAQTWRDRDGKPAAAKSRHLVRIAKSHGISLDQPPTPTPTPTATPTPTPTTAARPPPPPTLVPTLTIPLRATIDPARDVTGTWRGGVNVVALANQVCQWSGPLTMALTQAGNTVGGTATVTLSTAKVLQEGVQCNPIAAFQTGVVGTVSASAVQLTLGADITLTGSFTTDLMQGRLAWGADFVGCFQAARTSLGALPDCANPFVLPTPTPIATLTPQPSPSQPAVSITSAVCSVVNKTQPFPANPDAFYITWQCEFSGTASGPEGTRILLEPEMGGYVATVSVNAGSWTLEDRSIYSNQTGLQSLRGVVFRGPGQPATTTWSITFTTKQRLVALLSDCAAVFAYSFYSGNPYVSAAIIGEDGNISGAKITKPVTSGC